MSEGAGNAEIILVRKDGALILQHRDDKPGITNPGFVSTFGGHIEEGEDPLDAAFREIHEETNLVLDSTTFEFFGKYHKTKEVHGEDWDVYYYVVRNVDDTNLEVYEGQGFKIVKNHEDLSKEKMTLLAAEVLGDYFKANS